MKNMLNKYMSSIYNKWLTQDLVCRWEMRDKNEIRILYTYTRISRQKALRNRFSGVQIFASSVYPVYVWQSNYYVCSLIERRLREKRILHYFCFFFSGTNRRFSSFLAILWAKFVCVSFVCIGSTTDRFTHIWRKYMPAAPMMVERYAVYVFCYTVHCTYGSQQR